MNIEFANRLVDLRKRENLSQEDLADKLSISRQAVSKWERGEASPDTDNLIALAKIYGISLDELVNIKKSNYDSPKADEEVVAFKSHNNEFIAQTEPEEDDFFDEDLFEDDVYQRPRSLGKKYRKSIWVTFPVIPMTVLVFLFLGFAFDLWHPGWLVFLVFPLIHSIFLIREKRSHLTIIAVSMTALFLILGITFNLWHPAWLLFLMIPIISAALKAIRKKRIKAMNPVVPIIIVVIYILLGTYFDLWHPGWLVFLTIPIIHWLIDALEKRRY